MGSQVTAAEEEEEDDEEEEDENYNPQLFLRTSNTEHEDDDIIITNNQIYEETYFDSCKNGLSTSIILMYHEVYLEDGLENSEPILRAVPYQLKDTRYL
mmetsp:Transcript_710/g.989  ORF Transcript_710/g.989 Transcript_710/m.989 type:complete len:99 (-) Transcript_710:99-395(-)